MSGARTIRGGELPRGPVPARIRNDGRRIERAKAEARWRWLAPMPEGFENRAVRRAMTGSDLIEYEDRLKAMLEAAEAGG